MKRMRKDDIVRLEGQLRTKDIMIWDLNKEEKKLISLLRTDRL